MLGLVRPWVQVSGGKHHLVRECLEEISNRSSSPTPGDCLALIPRQELPLLSAYSTSLHKSLNLRACPQNLQTEPDTG